MDIDARSPRPGTVYVANLEVGANTLVTFEYAPATKQIGESTWYHACREFQVGGFCATDPYVEIETTVPHHDTRTAILKIPRYNFLSLL